VIVEAETVAGNLRAGKEKGEKISPQELSFRQTKSDVPQERGTAVVARGRGGRRAGTDVVSVRAREKGRTAKTPRRLLSKRTCVRRTKTEKKKGKSFSKIVWRGSRIR
jgi:hypothetical protein